jgi:hypothetical protein
MRLVAPDLRPLQLDVAASSTPSLVPKISLAPKISSFRIAPIARRSHLQGETDNLAG